ncbi:MAG: glycoside hydrolase family 3 C-terminal domain-containing protein [Candidatus Heimdallarchaeota archaeon]|nr:glycoside hydrolase family 3 C-terminal domain-containing protein [Candidatus Heimdallarchaeota archaeon]
MFEKFQEYMKYRKKIKQQVKSDKAELKRNNKERKSLPAEERKQLNKEDKLARIANKQKRKAEIKNMDKVDANKAKRHDRLYNKFYFRKRRIGIGILSFLLILILTIVVLAAIVPMISYHVEDAELLEEARGEAEILNEQIEAEGIVLLQNDDNILPLSAKVNIFGFLALNPYYSGTGGGTIDTTDAVNFYSALDKQGIEYNPEIKQVYDDYFEEVGTEDARGFLSAITSPNLEQIEMPVDRLTSTLMSNAKSYSETAIIFVGLNSGEAHDVTLDDLRSIDESEMIDLVASTFDNVIVIVNAGNPPELAWIDQYDSIKAAMLIGYPGLYGFRAVAKILDGTYNPSGKLVDTLPYNVSMAPSMMNAGSYFYEDGTQFVSYEEGIYIGYRFWETYYHGNELGYKSAVQFPFGHGLSYTSFDWTLKSTLFNDESMSIQVDVTNNGSVAGKDVVQLYYSAPYYERSDIEKPAVALVSFVKTGLLAPGATETVSIEFDTRDMASYSMDAGAFILENGTYDILVSRNAHDAILNESFVLDNIIEYKYDEVTNTEISNKLTAVAGNINYMTRSDFDASFPKSPEGEDFVTPQSVTAAKGIPEYSKVEGTEPTTNADNDIELADLKGKSYDDPLWEDFLDQFKVKEMAKMYTTGGWMSTEVSRLGVEGTLAYDGPADIGAFIGVNTGVGFPNEMILTQTWNIQLAYDMAIVIAKTGRALGAQGWYAPAMNMHRTPIGGRTYEYYSEDPVIAGMMAVAEVQGANAGGITAYIKHFVLNDQEFSLTGRYNTVTWVNEQAMREIYLKPFEMAVKDGNATGLMASLNNVGAVPAILNKALLTDILRDEWGFRGRITTDAYGIAGDSGDVYGYLLAGIDTLLEVTPFGSTSLIMDYYDENPVGVVNELREATHNTCYMVLQTYLYD